MNDEVNLLIPLSSEALKAHKERIAMLNQLRAHGFNMELSIHQIEFQQGRVLVFKKDELIVTVRKLSIWILESHDPKCAAMDFRIDHAGLETVLKVARFVNIID
jgi:hypothetical protein